MLDWAAAKRRDDRNDGLGDDRVEREAAREDLATGRVRAVRHIPRACNHSDVLTRKCAEAGLLRFREAVVKGELTDTM